MAQSSFLFLDLYAALREEIVTGALPVGARLAPSRVLAKEKGLSRTTVLAAYEQLIAEGYVTGKRGSGYWIREGVGELYTQERAGSRDAPLAQERDDAERPRPSLGQPDLTAFPKTVWARTVARVARSDPESLYAPAPLFGDLVLRQAIADQLARWRGVVADAEQIIVTAGAGDGLEICIRTLLKQGDQIGLEEPGYPPLRHFAASLGLRQAFLPVGPFGAELPPQGHEIPLVVLTPTHQFPLGGAMAPERRAAFMALAHAQGAFILEDDYDSEFRFAGQPIPAMQSQDQTGTILYAGSFSKIFSTSLRLGYLVVPKALIGRFETTLKRYGTKVSAMVQRPMGLFLSEGHLVRHIRRMRRIYGERRRLMMGELKRRLGDFVDIPDHQAGLLIQVLLPSGCDDQDIARSVNAAGSEVAALSDYYAHPRRGHKGLLIGYSTLQDAQSRALLDALEGALRSKPNLD